MTAEGNAKFHQALERLLDQADDRLRAVAVFAEPENGTMTCWMSVQEDGVFGPVAVGLFPHVDERARQVAEAGWFTASEVPETAGDEPL